MDLQTIAASVAGAVGSKLVFHPLDTIRTLQQTSTNFSYILPFARYWRGLGASLALTTPAFTVYLVSYRQCKQELAPYLGEAAFFNYVASGAVAELTSSFIWTPMEVVKGRMQILETSGRNTVWLIKDIYRKESIRGFFRGYWMGVGVFLPHSVVWWTSYEVMKKYLAKDNSPDGTLSAFNYGLSSAVATTSAATGSNFLDVVKTRQQLAVAEEISKIRPDDQQSVIKVARNLIKEVGLFRALFKGLHIRLMQSLPTSILSMIIVETVKPDINTQPKNDHDEILQIEVNEY